MNIEEYIKTHKGSTNVTWALFVQDNIKKGDYARLTTGQIVKVIGIKENKLNKKAIYFEPYDEYNWCDSMAVKSFSENIMDLIEEDIVILEYYVSAFRKRIQRKFEVEITGNDICFLNNRCSFLYDREKQKFINGKGFNVKIKSILTHELYEQNCYKVGG